MGLLPTEADLAAMPGSVAMLRGSSQAAANRSRRHSRTLFVLVDGDHDLSHPLQEPP